MAQLIEYKCPCCGGAIGFDSGLQKLKCPYCDTEFEPETLKNYDEALKNDAPDNIEWTQTAGGEWQDGEENEMRSYVCNSCGGEIVGDANMAATSCPFCSNPVVVSGNLSGSLKPDIVIPFKLDKEAAKAAFSAHLKDKKLLPKVFKDQNHIDEIKGIYVPFWLFDADADANIRYKATRVRAWRDSRYDYTETSFYSVLRQGTLSFDAVPVDGSSKMADDLMESVEPFDISQAVDFSAAYLAGYFADKYDVTAEESVARANARVKEASEQAFADTVQGFATVIPEASSVSVENGRVRYALYPVWILNTTWQGNKYTFAMNGQTGKFVGDLPLDKGAYWRWTGLVAAIGAAVFYAAAWLVHIM